ncbi:MAG: hypothetical protein KGY39_07210 [Anaerolineales bacterium]|nr:hypothetical protein [Anaerolineales bacterium]
MAILKKSAFVLVIPALAMVLSACMLSSIRGPELESGPDIEEGDEEVSPQAQGNGSEEEVIEPAFEGETLPCPPKGTTLYLGFDHALTINYSETSLTHFLHQGWLQLEVVNDQGAIAPLESPPLTYSMEGVMSEDCSLTGEGTMKPTAHGRCENGVVSLTIEENWLAYKGEMECIDRDGNVVIIPMNIPPMGIQTHTGKNGEGEVFYLVDSPEGYSSMRPFAAGSGYHTWALYTEDIPLAPLVPEE